MCLTLRNQLTLLHDLLYEQITYNTVHLYEYKQIKKIIQQLMKQQTLNRELHQILPEIYYFGIKGELASSTTDHVKINEQKLLTWLQIIEHAKNNTMRSG